MSQPADAPEPGTEPLDARIAHCTRQLGIAEIENVCLVIWRGAVTPESFEHQRQALHEIVASHPRGAGFLCVIESDTPPPNERMRKASIQMIDRHGERLRGVACVIEGSGFRAALTRSVLSSIALLLSRRELAITFEANVKSAATWLAQRCGVSATQLQLADRELRRVMSSALS